MAEPKGDVIQSLLADNRTLKIEAQRLRLEAEELRARFGRPDPRLETLEAENRRLREELAGARTDRDALGEGIAAALDRLRRG
ncbi:MAG: hypothetical protein ACREPA_00660 [Candidatus Dormibacteraceae bacterium]